MDSPPSPQILLDSDAFAQLNNPDARSLLDTIDSLRALRVGNLVNLPQIIVVGDQSSGKSSVLEAISRVRFPVDGDLCTRFATELVLRRAPETAVAVGIQYTDPDASHLPGQPFQRSSFDKDAIPDIIREAKELIGIRKGAKKFSKDILRVEIASPDVYPLTLVDLPGIFHSETAEQDRNDKEIVDELIDSYMRQPKSIILAVVAANNQLANQEVLQKAKEHDPNKDRTIGVITKPDMAGRGSANEKKYLDLARGREAMHKLALGWYVLRNRSEEERSSEADVRDLVEERFFQTGEWSSINAANKGIESLRKRLSKVLLDHIKTSLPDLIRDIESNLQTRQQNLVRLGNPRSTTEELRSYLLNIADNFKHLATDAVEGRYGNAFFGGLDQDGTGLAKLRALLRNMNWAFETIMETKGARYKIINDDADDENEDPDDDKAEFPPHLQQLIDDYGVEDPELKREWELNDELQVLASINQGREFPGDSNPELVFMLFKKQASRWQGIAHKHIDRVLGVAKAFVEHVFGHLVGQGSETWKAIMKGCVDPFFAEKQCELENKLQELLLPYIDSYGLPLERRSSAKMYEHTLRRFAGQLSERLEEQHPEWFQSSPGQGEGLSRDKILDALRESERPEKYRFGTEKILDMMMVHYEMSLRVFIDNVINLAVESCLVRKIPTILTPMTVNGMGVDRLKELASESEEVQKHRQALEDEVRILREGLGKCQKHKSREVTALPAILSRLSLGAELAQPRSRSDTPRRSPTPVGDPSPAPAPSLTEQPSVAQNGHAKAPAAKTPQKPLLAQDASTKPSPPVVAFGQASVPSPPPGIAKFVDKTNPPSKAFYDTSRTSPLSQFTTNPGPSVLRSDGGSSAANDPFKFHTAAAQPPAGGKTPSLFVSGTLFGTQTAAQPPASGTGSSLFGGSASSVFGKPAAQSSTGGSNSTIFGAEPAAQPSTGGNEPTLFGIRPATQPTGRALFGNPTNNNKPAFGA